MTEPLEIEVGGQTLRCHVTATRGELSQTSGPPERCHPGSPDMVEVERVELIQHIADDLTPDARATREIHFDITDLVVELGGLGIIEEKCDEAYTWPEPGDDEPEREPEQSDD